MEKSVAEIRNFFADYGLTDTDVAAFVRFVYGRHRFKAFGDWLDGLLDKERAIERKRQREGHIKAMWRRLRTDVRTKYHAAKHRAKKMSGTPDSPDFIYYDTLTKVLEKTLARVDSAYAKARLDTSSTVMLTPTQFGASKGMPNNGLTWADWVKPQAREMVDYLADEMMVGKHPKARRPRPFRVSPPEMLKAQRRRLHDLLDMQQAHAEERLRLLEEALPTRVTDSTSEQDRLVYTRRILVAQAEVQVLRRAKQELDLWPRLKPLPVDPIQLTGTRMSTVAMAIEDSDVEPLVAGEIDRAEYRKRVSDVVEAAIREGKDGVKQRIAQARRKDEA